MSEVLYCVECDKEFWVTKYTACRKCRKEIEKKYPNYFKEVIK